MTNYSITVSQPNKIDGVMYIQTNQQEADLLVYLMQAGNTVKLDGYDLPIYSAIVVEEAKSVPPTVTFRANKLVTMTYYSGSGVTLQTNQVVTQFPNLMVEIGGAQRLVNLSNQN